MPVPGRKRTVGAFGAWHLRAFVGGCILIGPAAWGQVSAQEMTPAEFRAAALAPLGGRDLDRIEIRGTGWDACLGQAWLVAEGWARWEIMDYRRAIDYRNGTSVQSAQRRAGLDPGRAGGCGAQPGAAARQQRSAIAPGASWPEQLPIWLTPHGFLELLEAERPTIARDGGGWQAIVPLVRDSIEYTFIGDYNGDYELERIRTWIDNSVFGDMEVLAEFGDYRDFGDLSFPASLTLKQGGLATLDLAIDAVLPDAEVALETASPGGRPRGTASGQPPYSEIGEGIFVIRGSYQAVAVEFDEFSVVVGGLQSDSRVQEIIARTKEAIPGKPIRYVVSTHSHFDHASGLRQFAAEGAVILTHAANVPFFEQALSAPRTLRRDAAEPNEVSPRVEGVDGRYEIGDGSGQRVEIHVLEPSPHAADMLIAFLPSIETVVEADILQPWINPVFGGGRDGPHPYLVYLGEELARLGLDYQQFVPIHVPAEPPAMPRSALEEALSGPAPSD